MKLQTVSQTGVGSSSAIVVNTNISPVNIGFGVVVTGSATYTVQHTFDSPGAAFVTWYPHPTIAAKTDNQDGNYAFPVTGIRISITLNTGTVTLNLVQAGI
jgi:hypothetical protein